MTETAAVVACRGVTKRFPEPRWRWIDSTSTCRRACASGCWVPIRERLSGVWLAVAEALPLLHPVRLIRAAFRGEAAVTLLWDVAYIGLLTGALLLVAARVTRRRLTG